MNVTNKGKQLLIALYCTRYDQSVGMSKSYINFFSRIGEVILVTSENNLHRIIRDCDVLALPGGADVASTWYGEKPGLWAGDPNPQFEYLDAFLLRPWIRTGKPIIGICRGIQAMNVHMGGTLHQHITGHVQDMDEPRSATLDYMYTDIQQHRIVPINSFHHQAICRLANGFDIIGWSAVNRGCPTLLKPDDKQYFNYSWITPKDKGALIRRSKGVYPMIIELIKHRELPYIGFQYHPEDMMDEFSLSQIEEVLTNYYNVQLTYATETDLAKANGKNQEGPVR